MDDKETALATLDTLAEDTFALLEQEIQKQLSRSHPQPSNKSNKDMKNLLPSSGAPAMLEQSALLLQICRSPETQTAMKQLLVDMFNALVKQCNEYPGGVQAMSSGLVTELHGKFHIVLRQYMALDMLIQKISSNKMDMAVKDFVPMFSTLLNELQPFVNDTWIFPFNQQMGEAPTVAQIQEVVRDKRNYGVIPVKIGPGHEDNAANAGGRTQNPREEARLHQPVMLSVGDLPLRTIMPTLRQIHKEGRIFFTNADIGKERIKQERCATKCRPHRVSLFKRPTLIRLGSYKHCLLLYTTSAALMTLSQINSLAAWYAPKGGYLFYSTVTIYPIVVQTSLIYLYIAAFTFNLITTAWAFMIRLSTLLGSKFLRDFKTIIPMFVLSIALWTTGLSGIRYTMHPNQESLELYGENVWNASHIALSEVGYVAAIMSKNGVPQTKSILHLTYYSFFMAVINCCIFTCWLKIRQRLKLLRELQRSNFKFHYRLYILLSFQAFFPLIFNTIPSGITFIVGIFQLEWDFIIATCGSILSFAQILDPILTACLITDYRTAIIRLLCIKRKAGQDSSTGLASGTR